MWNPESKMLFSNCFSETEQEYLIKYIRIICFLDSLYTGVSMTPKLRRLFTLLYSHCDVYFLLSFVSFISSKGFEGSDYKDGTSGKDKADNSVPSGEVFTYSWEVPERAGPGTDGPACSTWAYYSDVNPIKDTNSGLVGPLIVCKKVRNN